MERLSVVKGENPSSLLSVKALLKFLAILVLFDEGWIGVERATIGVAVLVTPPVSLAVGVETKHLNWRDCIFLS